MVIGLVIACAVLFCMLVPFVGLYVKSRNEIARLNAEIGRFGEIQDLEQYKDHQRNLAESAKTETTQAQVSLGEVNDKLTGVRRTIESQESLIADQQKQLVAMATMLGAYKSLQELKAQIEKQKQRVSQYNQVLGDFKSAEQLKAHIADQSRRADELRQTIGMFTSLAELDEQIVSRRTGIARLETRVKDLDAVLAGASTASELHNRIVYQQNLLAELEAKARKVEEVLEMQEFGFYHARYDFETSSQYQKKLDQIRAQQEQMIKGNTAVAWEKSWVVEGSEAKGRKMMAEQTKLMLRAFNGECDAAIAKVKYNNATTLESRINRSCEQLNKLGKTNSFRLVDAFLALKLQELFLVHEHSLKKQEEKEEQQRIREQMREEEKVQREIEELQRDAEKEETATQKALERARLEFERATKSQKEATQQTQVQNAALAEQVAKLERELQDAIDRKAKAIARAQLTKSGHVYILSNVGSFGENLYKIGLTRRLEPLERVKELGDASVPFYFDVHAMIYCEDAPSLECKLHKHFANRRVNLVNLRREFFHVTLDEIRDAVTKNFREVTFMTFPEAAEYRQTVALRNESNGTQNPVSGIRLLEVSLPNDNSYELANEDLQFAQDD